MAERDPVPPRTTTRAAPLLSLLIAAAIAPPRAGASEPNTKPLPAISALRTRIASASTLRILGTVYVASSSGRPVPCDWECTLDNRGRYRETLAIIGCDDAKTYRYTVCDGTRYMTVDDARREATTGAVLPLAHDLHLRTLRHGTIPAMLGLTWGESLFRPSRTEPIHGVETQVLELKSPTAPFLLSLWLNPTTGLPTRAANFLELPGKPPQPNQDWHTISIDAPLDDTLFALTPPPGYKVQHADQRPDDLRAGWAASHYDATTHTHMDCRFAFSLGDAVLLGWSTTDEHGQDVDPTGALPTLSDFDHAAAPPYRSKPLRRTTLKDGHSLTWILTLPDSPTAPSADQHRWVLVNHRKVGPSLVPSRINRTDLATILPDIQRAIASPTDAASQAPLTLGEVEAAATALRHGTKP